MQDTVEYTPIKPVEGRRFHFKSRPQHEKTRSRSKWIKGDRIQDAIVAITLAINGWPIYVGGHIWMPQWFLHLQVAWIMQQVHFGNVYEATRRKLIGNM